MQVAVAVAVAVAVEGVAVEGVAVPAAVAAALVAVAGRAQAPPAGRRLRQEVAEPSWAEPLRTPPTKATVPVNSSAAA